MTRPRLHLVHGPTPIVKPERLAASLGLDLWVKRDDMTGGAEAGNKVRKLEFLLGDARAKGADVVLTCGGLQSNHARATAIAASLGMRALLFLRTTGSLDGRLPRSCSRATSSSTAWSAPRCASSRRLRTESAPA